jgi:serine/threonine protein kinase
MELLDGETLRTRLQARGSLDASETWTIVRHVARAMTLTHTAGFVHRDLKPDNIFLCGSGADLVAKVLDFGITKALVGEAPAITLEGTVLGTCDYMSPEQAEGHRVDSRSDLWSLGVIAFECLTGSPPFRADSLRATLVAICARPIVVPSDVARVPVGFDAWFARAVCRDLRHRFQTAHELSNELGPVLEAPHEWVGVDPTEALTDDRDTLRIQVSATSARDRRSDVRIPSSIPAGIDGRRDLLGTALVYNASRGGALLATQRAWELEQALELTLHLDSPMTGESVAAHVVRVSRRDDSFWKFEVGVRFSEPLPDELLRRVEAKANRAHVG